MGFAGQHIESMPGHEPFALEEAVVLGYNVEHLRTAQDLSKTMFANMAGISRPTLNKIEQGTADPQLSIVRRIADALNVTVVQLLTPPRIVPRRIAPGYQTMPTYRMMPLPDPLGAPGASEAVFEELEEHEGSETPEGEAFEAFEAAEADEAAEAGEEAVSESGAEVAAETPEAKIPETPDTDEEAAIATSEVPEVLLDHMRRIPIHAPAPMVAQTVSTSQSTGSHMRLGTNS